MLQKHSACVYVYTYVSMCVFKIDTGQIFNVSIYTREYKTNLDHKLSQVYSLLFLKENKTKKNTVSEMVSQTYTTK